MLGRPGDQGLRTGLRLVGIILAMQGVALMILPEDLRTSVLCTLLSVGGLVLGFAISADYSTDDRESFLFVVLVGLGLSGAGAIGCFVAGFGGFVCPRWLSGLAAAVGVGMAFWGASVKARSE